MTKDKSHRPLFPEPGNVYLGGVIAGIGLGLLISVMLIGQYQFPTKHEVFFLLPWFLIAGGGFLARRRRKNKTDDKEEE